MKLKKTRDTQGSPVLSRSSCLPSIECLMATLVFVDSLAYLGVVLIPQQSLHMRRSEHSM
jgi:hypothetical protein